MENTRRFNPSRLVPLAVLIGAGLVLGYLYRDALSFSALAENREALIAYRDAHFVLMAVLFVLAYAGLVALSLPGALIATLTGGFLFGVFPGTLFNVAGATLGASALFLAARWGLGDWLAARMDASDGKLSRIKRQIDQSQWSMLFILRLVPVVPFFVANLLPALVGVAFSRYVISTFIGIIPGALVYTSLGAGLGSVFERGETPDVGIIFSPPILLPLLGLSALALLPVFLRTRGKDV